MKKKLVSLAAAALVVFTLALSGGCCHHRMHGDGCGCNCKQACGKAAGCTEGAPCNQGNGAPFPNGKPCCSQPPAEAPAGQLPK